MRPPLKLEEMSEQEFDGLLFRSAKSMARTLGWSSYHTLRSRGSRPGFPDRTCWKERTLFVETKGPKTRIELAQENTLDALVRARSEVYLWRPMDYDEAGLVLGRHWSFVPYQRSQGRGEDTVPPHLVSLRGPWIPRSMWIPGVGRAENLPDYEAHAGSPSL